MDNLSHVKHKKKVTFGKAKVRLLFDYNDKDYSQEGKDEKTSREIVKMKEKTPQTPIQPKSILKPTMKAVSMDSGLNTLHVVPKRSFEWEKINRNVWEPFKHKRIVKRKLNSRSESNISQTKNATEDKKGHKVKEELNTSNETDINNNDSETRPSRNQAQNRHLKSKNDILKQAHKHRPKQNESDCFTEDELVSSSFESENDTRATEKQGIKNNEKWEGFISHTNGLEEFVGIYSGVEGDWDETRQSLSRIGVDVDEEKLQNPREFVAIMNMFLSKQSEKPGNQGSRQNEQKNMADHSTELQYNKDESRSQQMNAAHDSNSSCETERKHTTTSEITDLKPQEEALGTSTKDNPTNTTQKPVLSKEELRKRIKKLKMKGIILGRKENTISKLSKNRSDIIGDHNMNYLPENYEKHATLDRFRSGKEKSEKNKRRQRNYCENNLHMLSNFENERKKYKSGSNEDINEDTEIECSTADNDTYRDRCYSDNNLFVPTRRTVNISSERDRSSSFVTDGETSLHGEDLGHKNNRERPKVIKRDSWFLIKKQRLKSDTCGPNLDENASPEVGRNEMRGCSSERQLENVIQKGTSDEGREISVSGSDFHNKSSKQKNHQESTDDSTTEYKRTLLMIANQSGSEKEDSKIATMNATVSELPSASCDNTKGQEYERKDTTNTVEIQKETARIKASNSNQFEESKNIDAQNTTPVAECSSSPKNDQKLQTEVSLNARPSQVKKIEKNRLVEHQGGPEITRENKKEPRESTEDECTRRNNQKSYQDELVVEKQFQNDISFILAESSKSMKSETYIKRAKERRFSKQQSSCFEINLKKKLVLTYAEAIRKNPTAGVIIPFYSVPNY